MSILSSSQSVRRYFIEGELPKDFPNNALPEIERYSFSELSDDSHADTSVGWVSAENPFLSPLMDNSYNRYTYIVMAMRIDKKTVPSKTLKSFVMKEQQKRLEEQGRERLSRNEIKDIRDAVYLKLLKQALPSINVYDFLWNLQESTLSFLSISDKTNNYFIDIFEKTFHVRLIKASPFSIAVHNGVEENKVLDIQMSFS